MSRIPRILPVSLLVLAVAAAVFLALGLRTPSDSRPVRAMSLPEPQALPEFSLVDQDGRAFTRDSLRGHFSLLFFGFTHCPDICPATLQQLAVARRRIAESSSDAPLPEIVLVSVDPDRDSPASLKEYVGHFGAGVTGVTGELDELRSLTGALGIFFEKAPGAAGDYSVNHSAVVLAVNRDAEFCALFGTPHDIDSFVNDVPLLMARQ